MCQCEHFEDRIPVNLPMVTNVILPIIIKEADDFVGFPMRLKVA